jgi:hypothetical protein
VASAEPVRFFPVARPPDVAAPPAEAADAVEEAKAPGFSAAVALLVVLAAVALLFHWIAR